MLIHVVPETANDLSSIPIHIVVSLKVIGEYLHMLETVKTETAWKCFQTNFNHLAAGSNVGILLTTGQLCSNCAVAIIGIQLKTAMVWRAPCISK